MVVLSLLLSVCGVEFLAAWQKAPDSSVDATPAGGAAQEARNIGFFPSEEKFHAVVLKGVRKFSDALQNPPMKFLL